MKACVGGLAACAGAVALMALQPAAAQQQGAAVPVQQRDTPVTWLDRSKPAGWNRPGLSIPPAPSASGPADSRCSATARPPELPEDERLRERGWQLVGAYRGGWGVRVMLGTAAYDGMCRPMQYQAFVFVRGVFAGTLSPQPMDSRSDGALDDVWLSGGTQLTATFRRYAATDPLCCPSGATSVTFEIADGPAPVVRPMSASAIRP